MLKIGDRLKTPYGDYIVVKHIRKSDESWWDVLCQDKQGWHPSKDLIEKFNLLETETYYGYSFECIKNFKWISDRENTFLIE